MQMHERSLENASRQGSKTGAYARVDVYTYKYVSAMDVRVRVYAYTHVTFLRYCPCSWKHDSTILREYFAACVLNWKVYGAPKTPQQVSILRASVVVRIESVLCAQVAGTWALYRQALHGDMPDDEKHVRSSTATPNDVLKRQAWERLKGMDQATVCLPPRVSRT
jgi:hypothetical protein